MIDFAILQEAIPLVIIFGLVTIVCAFLLVYAKVKIWLRAALIPLVLALTFIGYITLVDVLGKPFPGVPPDGSRLVSFEVDIEKNDYDVRRKIIIIWVQVKGDHRLYKIPYSRALEEALLAERDKLLAKKRIYMGTSGLEGDGSPIKLYEIPWKEEMPKDMQETH